MAQIREMFIVDKWQISQPVNRTSLNYLIAGVEGVLSVYELQIVNLAGVVDGRVYSNTSYNIGKNLKNNILYCDDNAIFCVQYPNKDIVGYAK